MICPWAGRKNIIFPAGITSLQKEIHPISLPIFSIFTGLIPARRDFVLSNGIIFLVSESIAGDRFFEGPLGENPFKWDVYTIAILSTPRGGCRIQAVSVDKEKELL